MTHAGVDTTVQVYNEIMAEALLNREAMFLEDVAMDNAVIKTGQIMAYGSYDRNKLVDYVSRYGYEVMNAFIADWRKRLMAKKEAEQESENNG